MSAPGQIESRPSHVVLALFNSEYGNDYTGLMAATTAATVPVVLLFALLQKQFVQGIVMTGLKG